MKKNFLPLLAVFIFQTGFSRNLEKLELIKLTTQNVDLVDDLEKVIYPESEFIEIPFTLIEGLITVEVILNNKKRTFIFDTGAPDVVLNSKYLSSNDTINSTSVAAKGVGGNISGVRKLQNKSLNFAGIIMENAEVMAMDISHLEESIKHSFNKHNRSKKNAAIKIHGLIGYSLIKDYDVLYDYKKKTLTLIQPEAYQKYVAAKWPTAKSTSIPVQMVENVVVVTGKIGAENYNLIIDSGASANLLSDQLLETMDPYLKKRDTETLSGADTHNHKVIFGKIKKMKIGAKAFKKMTTVFSDISHLMFSKDLKIDGLIGYEVLSKQKTVISYKHKTLTFID